ncbi:calcium binding protein [Anaeramoeba flamelloides]|uniref:Calcium binding protein n=1 Tax=Anaeramoeba flamelloides TaxID=1746091 RepID=A0AAV7Y8P9_9EUKA|nr:calcium binding protein [Anaeramoeba flamelloides]KAJ6228152.1 calcium binding protein [Anaeramoeba flamelloides]|eukprot:Anaeramoba_flamelloidesc40402_g1_i1.p1 GENE.c40402_g1_i1~~c40402_g1_i1.p1  ORF type:complete len:188 (-),score=57.66 c40402_g1_i1:234-797(-)
MGGCSTKIKLDEEIEKRIQENTEFDLEEIRLLYKRFMKENPDGVVRKEDFHLITEELGFKDDYFADLLFEAIDTEGNGKIDFEELCKTMSTTMRGKLDQKLEFVFKVYDLDGNGLIERDELHNISEAIFKMVGENSIFQDNDEVQKYIDEAFDEADQDGDGGISLEEFKSIAKSDPKFLQSLGPFRA